MKGWGGKRQGAGRPRELKGFAKMKIGAYCDSCEKVVASFDNKRQYETWVQDRACYICGSPTHAVLD